MADVLVSNYRYSEQDKDGNVTRHVLRPGDKASDLPKEVRDDLKKRRLIRDEKWLDNNGDLRSAEEVANDNGDDEEVEFPRETPARTPSQMADPRDREEVVKQAQPSGGDSGKGGSDDDSKKSSKKGS